MSQTAQQAAPATNVREPPRPTDNRVELGAAIADAIRQQLSENGRCPYVFYFKEVQCECCRGVVKLQGRVPTFRLKSVLLSLIEDLDGIIDIDDQLDVISSTGLSSVRPR